MTEENTVPDYKNEGNLLLRIWTSPRLSFRYILATCPEKYLVIFYVLGGISNAIDRAATKNMGDKMSTAMVLFMAIVAGGLLGWMGYFIYAFFLSWTGSWIKGTASASDFRIVLAWSSVPLICSLVLLVPELIFFGDDVFRSETGEWSTAMTFLWVFIALIDVTLGVWSIVITVAGVSVIQNFSIGKAIFNLLLPVFILIGIVLILVVIFKIMF